MKSKNIKWVRLCSIGNIIAYLIMYIIAFNAFDDSGVVNYFENGVWRQYYSTLITFVGAAFTLELIAFLLIKYKKSISGSVGIIIFNILQLPMMILANMSAVDLKSDAVHAADKISEFHCLAVIVISYIIIALVVVSSVLSVFCFVSILKNQKNEISDNDVEAQPVKEKSYVHIPVLIALVFSTFAGCFQMFSPMLVEVFIYGVLYSIAFAVPAMILLGEVVRIWIEQKKYILAVCSYVLYMYIAYGVTNIQFDNWLKITRDGFNVLYDGLVMIEGVNFGVAVVVIVFLVVKAVKEKIDKSS